MTGVVVAVFKLRATWSVDYRVGRNVLTDTLPMSDKPCPVKVGDVLTVSGSGRIVRGAL